MKRSSDFARLRHGGKTRAGKYLVVSHLHHPELITQTKFLVGIITSRKVGMAVIRNRARRRIRALVDEMADRMVPGTMMVIIARYTIAKADYTDLRRDWDRIATKMGFILPPSGA